MTLTSGLFCAIFLNVTTSVKSAGILTILLIFSVKIGSWADLELWCSRGAIPCKISLLGITIPTHHNDVNRTANGEQVKHRNFWNHNFEGPINGLLFIG